MHNEIVMLFSDIKCFCKYSLQQVHNKLVVIRCPCDLKIITLSLTDCPVETSAVTAIVTGSTDNTGYYKNEGTAENIQIELRDDQDATLKNGDSKTVIVDEITRNAQFPLKARAITVNGNASQGTIEALINVIYTWQ